jgi:UDP-N-acetylmuramate dehydrogenase
LAPTALGPLTTLRIGGPARRVLAADDEQTMVAAVADADAAGEPVLVLAGGSNVVIGDAGFPGLVVRVAGRGIAWGPRVGGGVTVTIQAGEPWDGVVAQAVADGLAGIECLSGIPGSAGATPIQNVGAYGQEIAGSLAAVRVFDRRAGTIADLSPAACRFGYRTSAFRAGGRYLVLAVSLTLAASRRAAPVSHPQLARLLGVAIGARPPLEAVRAAVIELRRSKGMVLDPADPDSVSAGSFFRNPLLTAAAFARLERRLGRRGDGAGPPRFPLPDGRVKVPAAWLVERAGFGRGYGAGRVGISSKHTLALVNRGGATSRELLALAREIAAGVRAELGVELVPEPVLVGERW